MGVGVGWGCGRKIASSASQEAEIWFLLLRPALISRWDTNVPGTLKLWMEGERASEHEGNEKRW